MVRKLAFLAMAVTFTGPSNMTRSEAVEAKIIALENGKHLFMRYGLELLTSMHREGASLTYTQCDWDLYSKQ